jgi:hypothetical protein
VACYGSQITSEIMTSFIQFVGLCVILLTSSVWESESTARQVLNVQFGAPLQHTLWHTHTNKRAQSTCNVDQDSLLLQGLQSPHACSCTCSFWSSVSLSLLVLPAPCSHVCCNIGSSVSVVLGYGLHYQGSIPGRDSEFFRSPPRLDLLWGPLSLLYNG